MHSHLHDGTQVRYIDVIEIVLKEIILSRHQFAHALTFRRFPFMAGDFFGKALAKLFIQGAHQAADAILADVRIGKLLAADRGDGAANPVTIKDPVEALARMHAVMEGDLDELL